MENEVKEVAVEEQSSHHHHSHHHHHHHHKSGKKKKKFSLKRLVKKYKTPFRILAFTLAIVLTIGATVLTIKLLDKPSQGGGSANTPAPTESLKLPEGHVALSVTRFELPVTLHHSAVSAYLNTSISIPARDILEEYKNAEIRLDQGEPLALSYDVLGLAEGCSVTGFRVEVTEKGGKTPVFRKECGAGEHTVLLYNLKTAATYQYTIRADFTTMDSLTVTGEFETAAGPRLLKVDGIVNVRDFGGWKVGNTYIKQGLLYRGSELDGMDDTAGEFYLTGAGRQTMLELFGIHMEMDLREPAVRSEENRLGEDVLYPTPYSAPFFGAAFAEGKKAVGRVFKDLANPDNYPIYMHCSLGRDRTGTICLILGAVLGMEEEDLLREYGLSAMYYGDVDYQNAYKVLDGLKAYGGENLQQQAEAYLKDIGLEDSEIESLRQIYLG